MAVDAHESLKTCGLHDMQGHVQQSQPRISHSLRSKWHEGSPRQLGRASCLCWSSGASCRLGKLVGLSTNLSRSYLNDDGAIIYINTRQNKLLYIAYIYNTYMYKYYICMYVYMYMYWYRIVTYSISTETAYINLSCYLSTLQERNIIVCVYTWTFTVVDTVQNLS